MIKSDLKKIFVESIYIKQNINKEKDIGKLKNEINDIGTKPLFYKDQKVSLKDTQFKERLNIF